MVRKYYDKPQNSNNHNNKNSANQYQKKSNNKNINPTNPITNNSKMQQTNQPIKPVNEATINNLSKFAAISKRMNNSTQNINSETAKNEQSLNANTLITNTFATINNIKPIQANTVHQTTNLDPQYVNTPKPTGSNLVLQKVNKATIQQVSQTMKSLKVLEQLLDSYEQLQMDQNCDLKGLIQYLQNNKACHKLQQQN